MRARRKITHLILALLAVAIGFYAQSRIRKPDQLTEALLLYGVAAILFVVALRHTPPESEGDYPDMPPPQMPASRRWGVVALLAASLLALLWSLVLFSDERPPAIAWLFYLSSVGTFLAAFWLAESPLRLPSWEEIMQCVRHIKPEHIILILLLAASLFIRVYRLGELPLGVWYDEADNGLWARQMNKDPEFQPIYVGPANLPWHYLSLIALSFRIFGDGIVAVRLVSALFGTLTVWATYLLVRDLFGPRMGLVGAFIMAVSHWNVNFSRVGMYGITAPLFILLVPYLLNKGIRSQRRVHFALAGVALGLGMCFYISYLLFVPVIGFLLLHTILSRRHFLRHYISHLVIFAIAVIVAVAPIAFFAARYPNIFFNRTRTTSIFKDKTREQAISALKESATKHLLMFNYRGDGNGRHNLPGEPQLDLVTSVFFVLGVVYSLYRFRDPRYAALVVGLLVMLSGGIFSLDFEAPQSLRAIGTLPISHLLGFVAMARLWREFDLTFCPRRAGYGWLAVLPMLAYVGYTNLNIYFVKQANDFAVWNAYSTAETFTARRMKEMGSGYDYHVISLYFQTPTVRFLAPEITSYKRLETTDSMPIYDTTDKDTVLFIDPERRTLYEDVRRFYPTGKFEEITPPFGGPVILYIAQLTPAQIRGIQGLAATYYSNETWDGQPALQRKDDQISFDWSQQPPLSLPFSVEWQGTLRVPRYGSYRLGLRAPAQAELFIDETLVLDKSGEIKMPLAEGNHALRIRAVGAMGAMDFYWQPPGMAPQIVPMSALYLNPPVTNNGLLGRYFPNANWQGEPALMKIDPSLGLYFHITLLPRPYTVEWSGKLNVPTAGTYAFGLESIDDSWLYINDKLVVEAHVGNQYQQGQITLQAGLHDIRVRYTDKSNWSHINLFWSPPGKPRQIIPAAYLLPPQGSYPEMVEAAKPIQTTPVEHGALELTLVATWGGPGSGEGQFKEPRDIAVDNQGHVYVADTGNKRVQVLDAEGKFLTQWQKGDQPFVEPLALVVNSAGEILVLDSEVIWVYRFGSDGEYRGKFAGPEAQLYHPRGMSIDAQDQVYVADTGGGRFVVFDASGNRVATYGTMGKDTGQFIEPTDLVVTESGDIFAVDNSNYRIQHLDVFGRYLGEWAIPVANAYNGPHIELAPDGSLLVTAPEAGLIQRFAIDGTLLGQWGEGLMRIPVNLVLKGDRLYVTDTLNHRIQVFQVQTGQ